ncbi:hypothetical protein WA538_004734, partial [Blastocystis sp. DL]
MNEKTLVSRKRMVPDSTVHHIPCEIQYTGRAPVSDYFVVNSEQPVREAMLRGRLLRGKEIVMPKGIEGVVMMRSTGANRKETVEGIASFTKATQWYTDSIPKDNEGGVFDHCLEWMKVSDAINEIDE